MSCAEIFLVTLKQKISLRRQTYKETHLAHNQNSTVLRCLIFCWFVLHFMWFLLLLSQIYSYSTYEKVYKKQNYIRSCLFTFPANPLIPLIQNSLGSFNFNKSNYSFTTMSATAKSYSSSRT